MYHKMKHISSHTTEEYSPIWGLSQKITIGVVYRNINVGLRNFCWPKMREETKGQIE